MRAALCLATRVLRVQGREYSEGSRPGQHKTPITDYLWRIRAEALRKTKAGEEAPASQDAAAKKIAETKPQAPVETEVVYQFSHDASMRDKYVNPWGTIRVGRMLEDLDALAGNIAVRHCSADNPDFSSIMLVTASIDRVTLSQLANLVGDVRLSGKVTWVGNSSMEIEMQAISADTDLPWLKALFTFVARCRKSHRAVRINPLAPETDEEKIAFEAGQARAKKRKQMRKESTDAQVLRRHLEELVVDGTAQDEQATVSIRETAQLLYQKSKARLLMPASSMRNAVSFSDSGLSNTHVMQPQQKNTAGRIFGGFLVRRSYELAFSTAYLFAGTIPKFQEVDQVVFRTPVDVGDLVRYESRVLYTSSSLYDTPSFHIEVVARVLKPETHTSYVSNTFNFTFLVPEGTQLPFVVPETMEDAMQIVTRYYCDLVQKTDEIPNLPPPSA
ncbi:acyl-coenzyme A thioesterase [Diplonema papillatum]|nr:acyl-coenzyme A thioesterase [Diplonema papillatum]